MSAKIKNDIYAESHNVVFVIKFIMAHWDHLGISPNGEIYNIIIYVLAEYFQKEILKDQ